MSDPSADPEELYGAQAAELLRALHLRACEAADRFADEFYEALMQRDATQGILRRLDDAEFSRLRRQQARHLAELVSPQLGARQHRERALQVGRVHALVGVDMMWLTEAYGMYQKALHRLLASRPSADPALHPRILQIVDRRLLCDLQAQSAGYRQVDRELAQAVSRVQQRALQGRSLIDLHQGALRALCAIDGLAAAFVGRIDAQGRWEVEACEGPSAPAYLAAAQTSQAPLLQAAAGDAAGESMLALAWRSGQAQTCEVRAPDCGAHAWLALAAGLGLRSCAAVPLVDDNGRTHALLSLHSRWPGFFDAEGRRALLEQVQQILSMTASRLAHPRVVPYDRRGTYGAWLDAGRVRMLYQPIIELQSGALHKVEALARLLDEQGRMLAPGEFLPALGQDGLLRLFELGLVAAGADHRGWGETGLHLRVSLNLPPQAVGEPRYHETLFRVLESGGLPPQALELEILESGEGREHASREPFFERLRLLGVRIVQDDLGSGHSSLLRLDRMPFDEVKIDQGLVLEASRKDPQRAFAFILHLTQLAHALNVSVTVEGLEDPGLIEAAAILGADRGQGYAIARPMPAQDLPQWQRSYRHRVGLREPTTAWGALAGYLIWDRQLLALRHWPELIEDFVRAPCLVQRFLDAHGMRDSRLQRLLDLNHALAVHPASTRLYRRTRADIVQALRGLGAAH